MRAPLIEKILASRKYADIDRATVERIFAEESRKHTKPTDAEKAARRMLHIICRSFSEPDSCARATAMLDAYEGDADTLRRDRGFSRRIMELHASTRERLIQIDAFYDAVMPRVGTPESVLDIGCGFHPFALPWMELPPNARYAAWDIGQSNAALLNTYFRRMELPNMAASVRDAIGDPPRERFSLVFLLKLLPVLEQQRKGAACSLLENLNAGRIVVSFPTRSLTGKSKGMEGYYSGFLEECLLTGLSIDFRTVVGNELLYILHDSTNTDL